MREFYCVASSSSSGLSSGSASSVDSSAWSGSSAGLSLGTRLSSWINAGSNVSPILSSSRWILSVMSAKADVFSVGSRLAVTSGGTLGGASVVRAR